ncbi:MAG: preprotein translocase subunit YajC [Hellea sp.]|jgi:preprotein translocase subunit YajC|nr:preprotein translocase subunit YajC [Hellea sp.]MBT3592952.1 preprotein translocase subunit YajC [Hellea sp.]MBT4996422.1 preprotein translocase subunit YajC [Hellea sp.]MBT5837351.1 preprotein translocase subunit YajC [Hellea sp.]MDA8888700.1 preprotein translocase subunit YajC [Hellea sp.]MDB4844412.1 preprotein translocase subunit YajC [Hellea sp.]
MLNVIMQASPGGAGVIQNFLPILLIGVIFYFLLIRPQNQRMKAHKNMLSEISRGDVIVTNGGLVGKVKKVADDELSVDFNGTEIKVVRTMIADVRNKPAPANDTGKKKK